MTKGMNRRSITFISTMIFLFLAMPIYGAAVEIPLVFSTTTVFVDPPTSMVTGGQTFFIDIKISDVGDLYGWEFKLGWNPDLLNVVNVIEGNFLKQGGLTFFWPIMNNTEGYILVDCTLLGDVPGVSGSGTLATVAFYAENQGESILDLYNTILINSQEQTINPHTANDGTVTVEASDTVGGIWIPVNKLELLTPYIGLALAILIAVVATAVFVKQRRKVTETHSQINIQH
jgi:hypothetical protein